MSVDTQSKKLVDLRVVDLRQELEKRGLDKSGVKAVLTERLQKALEDEGKDPLEYVFETSDSVAKKATPVAKKTGQKDRSNNKEKDGEEEEEFLDDSLLEDDGLEMGNQDNKDDENDMKVLEESDEVNGSVEKVKEAVVNDVEMVDLDASEPLKDDEKMKTEEDATKENIDSVKEVFETKEEMPEASVDSSVAMETSAEPKSEEKMEATSVLEKAEPASDSVVKEGPTEVVTPSDEAETSKGLNVVSAENGKAENDSKSTETPSALNDFTVDDMIRLDTSMAKQAEDHESLDVHVDDTQNDLDSDILGKGMDSSESKAVEVAATSTTGESTTSSEKAPETTEPEKADGASAASIQEAPSTTTTSSDKPATAPATETDDKEKSSTPAAKSTPENKDEKNEEKKEDKGKSSSSTGRNLWVSGLSSSTRATDLKTIFSKYGKVVGAKVVTNARSPGSRCYGFVTMSSADEATKCIQHLHRTELHGKMISVERAKNEPGAQSKSSTTSNRKTDAPKSGPPRRDDRGRRDSDKKPDDRKSHDRRDDKKDTRKDDKAPHKDDRRDSHKKDDHKRDEHRKDEKKDDSKKDEKTSSSSSPSKRTTPKKDDKSRTVVMDKSKGEPVVSVDKKEGEENKEEAATAPDSREARAKSTTSTSRSEKGKDDKDVLSFEKIKEERDRERMRQRERRLREEERLRRREIDLEKKRQRDVHMKQRAEAIRLAREREKLRRERQQLEKEKLAAQRLEKLRQEQLERERLEREREEKRKLEQLRLEAEHLRRMAMKRPYESRTRDEYWSEPKRAALSDNRFTTSQTFSSDRFNTFDDSRDTRYGDRGTNSDSFERKVERYDRRDSRNLDSREDRTTRTLDRGRSDRDGRDDRRNEDRFDRFEHERERDRPVVRDDRRDNVGFSRDRDRIREPERRDERRGRSPVRDSRAEWKSERDLRPTQTDTRVVVRASSGGGRDGWQGGGASGSEDRTHSSRAPNTGLGLLGNAPSTQRQWGQGNDNRSKQDSSWSSRQTSDSRGSLSHGTTDRWSGGTGIGLQQDTHQTQFATQLPGSIITTGVPGNMLLTSVQTPAGMVLTNPALATRGQAEPRFDAYKNMQTQFRRY